MVPHVVGGFARGHQVQGVALRHLQELRHALFLVEIIGLLDERGGESVGEDFVGLLACLLPWVSVWLCVWLTRLGQEAEAAVADAQVGVVAQIEEHLLVQRWVDAKGARELSEEARGDGWGGWDVWCGVGGRWCWWGWRDGGWLLSAPPESTNPPW